jgi:hypothetical protein
MYNTVSTRKRTRESNDKTDLLHVLKMLDNSPHKKSRSDSPENFFYAPPSVVYAKENHLYFRSPVNDQSVSDLVNLIEDKNEDKKGYLYGTTIILDILKNVVKLDDNDNNNNHHNTIDLINGYETEKKRNNLIHKKIKNVRN